MRDNCDNRFHLTKRSLSRFEKSTLTTTAGRALILPAHPPKEGQAGEIEELLAVGYDPLAIIGVERDQAIAVELYEHYYTRCQIHCDELEVLLTRSIEAPFSYVHADFCSQLSASSLAALEATRDRMAPASRLRASVILTRRQRPQLAWERYLRHNVLGPLLASVDLDPEPSTDSTQILAAVLLLNHFFGLSTGDYADRVASGAPALPEPAGGLMPINLQRYIYHEQGGHTEVGTLWTDLVPFVRASIRQPEDLAAVVHQYFRLQVFPPMIPYNPDLYDTHS